MADGQQVTLEQRITQIIRDDFDDTGHRRLKDKLADFVRSECREAMEKAAGIAPKKKFWSQTDPNGRDTIFSKGYNTAINDYEEAIRAESLRLYGEGKENDV